MQDVLDLAVALKVATKAGERHRVAEGKTLALLFEKPSLRTRVSFEVAMRQLGGESLYLSPQEVQIGRRESVADVARVLSRYVDAVVLRTFDHQTIVELAQHSSIPVVNGLSDLSHPCQALADVLTIKEKKGRLEGVKIAFVGDGNNNVTHSLMLAAAKTGASISVACPPGYEPNPAYLEWSQDAAAGRGAVTVCHEPAAAVTGADVVYTDVWTSMGQESEYERRLAIFRRYQVNSGLLALAQPDAIVMHDLPAHRGEEITDDVIDGPRSVVFDQAENRLHAQKAVLATLLR
ncbi:MAG: ornithine carbamoyltransferase [Chloroflexi bacterium]|nr:ornithine carbamoyltransferase [Chloroflexota bacterium]